MMTQRLVIGEMIRFYLKKNKMTIKELGEILGKKESTVSKWINNKNVPVAKDLSQMTQIFHTDIQTLMYGGEAQEDIILKTKKIMSQLHHERQKNVHDFASNQLVEQQTQASRSTMIDLQAKQESQLDGTRGIIKGRETAAGLPIPGDEQDVNAVETIVHKRDVPESANEIVTVAGDSMEPDFPEYSQIFVHWQQSVDNGDLALVHVRDEGVTFKKIYIDNENKKVVLHSLNPKYQDRYFDADDIHVIGKVITE